LHPNVLGTITEIPDKIREKIAAKFKIHFDANPLRDRSESFEVHQG